MLFRQLFDRESCTYTYLLADEETRDAVLIDPVREHLERDLDILEELGVNLRYSLETHVHADHITSSGVLRKRVGCQTVLSAAAGAGCPDILIEDGQTLTFGRYTIEARHTPGHTNGDVTYVVQGADVPLAFTGDTLLIRGCGRTDFQQGDSDTLYQSVHEKIFSLPDETRIYPGHDYKGRTMSTVAEEKKWNLRLGGGRTRDEFRDIMANLNLAQPKKIDEAVPANLHCGVLQEVAEPAAEPTDADWAPVERSPGGVPEVTEAWLRDNLGAARLLDVRAPAELTGPLGAIDGVENVPLPDLASAIASWTDADPEKPIVTICRSGGRSGTAATMLEQAGFTRVASLRGGMLAYAHALDAGAPACG